MVSLDQNPIFENYIKATYPEQPDLWPPLTVEQADSLFNTNAVMMCDRCDGVPVVTALRLFGWRIVFTVHKWESAHNGRYMNAVGLNSCMPGMLDFFTRAGFLCAASLANQMTLLPEQQGMNEAAKKDFEEFDRREAAKEKKRGRPRKTAEG